jgi:serine/threonine protein kinase
MVMASEPAHPETRLGKYKLLSHIATGGMGMVYKAVDEESGRVVALKILDPALAKKPALVERFRREAQHAATLRHKNIVTLYEHGEDKGVYYLVLEYIDGIDLEEYIRHRGQLNPAEARLIVMRACKALGHAYSHGITHRDIKPSNFLLERKGNLWRLKLTDMGLARSDNEDEFRVTRTGHTVGTVDYMSPEQARDSASADIRSDIYSLGCTLYHMLAGQPPFAGGGIGERVYKHLCVDPPDVRQFNPRVSRGLWAVLQRMLAKNPDARYQNPSELLRALSSVAGELDGDLPPALSPVLPTDESSDSSIGLRALPADSAASPKPPSTAPELLRADVDFSDTVPLSTEQRQAAAEIFERATQVRASGNLEYALELLLSCCKLDPVTLLYRHTLRAVGRTAGKQRRRGWLRLLANRRLRKKFRAAKRAGVHLEVLQRGEELLLRIPNDVGIQIDMADSARQLKLPNLAAWLLEQILPDHSQDLTVLRTLAALYESQNRYQKAISLWEQVSKLVPTDAEATRKMCDLAATETLARVKNQSRNESREQNPC